MQEQIDNSLPLVEAKKLDDASIYLRQLRSILLQHKRNSNGRLQFEAKQAARTIFHALPEQLQIPVRTAVQKIQINQLNRTLDQAGHD